MRAMAASPRALASAQAASLGEFADAWETFFAAVRRARGRAGTEAGEMLSLSQYYLLAPLRDGEPRQVGVLASAAGVAQPTATRMLARLSRSGIVRRGRFGHDRRAVKVSLTAVGKTAWENKHARLERQRAAVFASLDEEEQRHGAVMLRVLAEVIEQL